MIVGPLPIWQAFRFHKKMEILFEAAVFVNDLEFLVRLLPSERIDSIEEFHENLKEF